MATFPQRWWKKQPLIIAHRGANLHAPENTLSAFRQAVQCGADGIELDVRLTADRIPVILHDSHVDGTTDGHGSVAGLTLREVKELDAGSWFSATCHETIPTFEEVLDEFGGKTIINIELKGDHRNESELAERVCILIGKMAMEESVWFSSFSSNLLRQTRKFLPAVPNGFLYTIQSPINSLKMKAIPVEAVHPYYRIVSRRYVERMQGINRRVAVWTVDDMALAQQCAEFKVDVIITNDPEKLLQILA